MSTRALYTFIGESKSDTWNVYKHHDGYPSGAAQVLQTTIDWFAWPLPRYEADAFAAAFCAAGKASNLIDALSDDDAGNYARKYFPGGDYHGMNGGGVRLMPQGNPLKVAVKNCSDIDYRYEIYQAKGTLRIRAYSVNIPWGEDKPLQENLLVECNLAEFAHWAEQTEAA